MATPIAETLRQFGFEAELGLLPGGSQPTFRAGQAVLKRIGETSLENNHSPQLIQWVAELSAGLEPRGFRLPQPIRATDGRLITDDGWTPWGLAHRWCWQAPPPAVQPQLRPLIQRLAALREPIQTAPAQLIHGDLNPENILIAPGQPPAFLDLSPF